MTPLGSQAHPWADRFLAAVRGRKSTAPPPPAEAADYDFTKPCCFTRVQLERLGEFADRLAKSASQTLSHELHGPVPLAATPIAQHYLSAVRANPPEQPSFYVPLTLHPSRGPGMLVLSKAQARTWVGTLLGSGAASQEDRPLSELETSLMFDVVHVVVECFNACAGTAGPTLEYQEQLLENCRSLSGQDAQEFLHLGLGLESAPQQAAVALLLPVEDSGPLAGLPPARKASPEQTRPLMLTHLQQAPLGIQVLLGSARLKVGELVQLQAGDVVLLDRRVGDPAELLVSGRRLFQVAPVASKGHYAAQVIWLDQSPA
jgi:flagellar motor switch protein FliM